MQMKSVGFLFFLPYPVQFNNTGLERESLFLPFWLILRPQTDKNVRLCKVTIINTVM